MLNDILIANLSSASAYCLLFLKIHAHSNQTNTLNFPCTSKVHSYLGSIVSCSVDETWSSSFANQHHFIPPSSNSIHFYHVQSIYLFTQIWKLRQIKQIGGIFLYLKWFSRLKNSWVTRLSSCLLGFNTVLMCGAEHICHS